MSLVQIKKYYMPSLKTTFSLPVQWLATYIVAVLISQAKANHKYYSLQDRVSLLFLFRERWEGTCACNHSTVWSAAVDNQGRLNKKSTGLDMF